VGVPTADPATTGCCYDAELNLFDNMQYGIMCRNGNLQVLNNAFAQTPRQPFFPFTPYGRADSPDLKCRLDVYGNPANKSYVNRFWDCSIAIGSIDLYALNVNGASAGSRHGYDDMSDLQGNLGVHVYGTYFYNMQMRNSGFTNPNDGDFVVQQLYPDNTQAEVSIYHAMGNLVLRRTAGFQNGLLRLDVTGTPPGVYLLQLLDGNGRASTIKFTIQ
jgi:Secretion system C-terminal sorting domain